MLFTCTRFSMALCALAICATSTEALSEDFYKGKTITVVIGSGVGGGYDVYGRLLAQYLGRHIPGNPRFIVENRPGASTTIASELVSRAAPDGHTLIMGSVNHRINPS